MSFYGNSYSYNIVESFAKIVLKNLGLKRTAVDSFPQVDNKDFFSLVDDKGSVVLEAESSKTGVTISSGNQWIKIGANHQLDGETGKKNNELCIMHGPPATDQSPIDFVLPVNIQSILSPQVQSIIDPVPIKFGDYLAIPLIKYDNAGHVVFSADSPESVYFQMPPDPNLEFEETLDEELKKVYNTIYVIDNSSAPAGTPNGKIQDLESKLQGLTDPNNGTIALLEDKVDEAVKDLSNVTDNVDAALKDFEENKLKPIEEDIEEIQEAKNKLEMIDGISSMATGVSSQVVALANWIKEHLDEAEGYSVNQLLGIEPI